MLGRVTKYRINNDAPSEVFEAESEQERMVSVARVSPLPCCLAICWDLLTAAQSVSLITSFWLSTAAYQCARSSWLRYLHPVEEHDGANLTHLLRVKGRRPQFEI